MTGPRVFDQDASDDPFPDPPRTVSAARPSRPSEESSSASSGGRAPRDAEAKAIRSRRRRNRLSRWSAPLLFVLPPLLVLGGGALWWRDQVDPRGAPGDEVTFTVEDGWTTEEIADALDDAGVIGSSFVFQMYVRTGDHGPFLAGTYELQEDAGVEAAVDALESGPGPGVLDVRILRGLRMRQVADQVAAQVPGVTAEEFMAAVRSGKVRSAYQPEGVDSLEGFLMPGRYEFERGTEPAAIARAMVRRFDRMAGRAGIEAAGSHSPFETVVIASLIEKEAVVDADRPLIASVVENRLADDMPLQLDASVLYAVGKDGGLTTRADRRSDSPYNTYRFRGLPPGPISNVSQASLQAALNPAQTDFLFYVLKDRKGNHAFAETFEEHQVNVQAARDKGLFG